MSLSRVDRRVANATHLPTILSPLTTCIDSLMVTQPTTSARHRKKGLRSDGRLRISEGLKMHATSRIFSAKASCSASTSMSVDSRDGDQGMLNEFGMEQGKSLSGFDSSSGRGSSLLVATEFPFSVSPQMLAHSDGGGLDEPRIDQASSLSCVGTRNYKKC
jgi:hypothetical protein